MAPAKPLDAFKNSDFLWQAFAPAKPAYMPSLAIRARKRRAQNLSVYKIHEYSSTTMTLLS